MSQRPDRSTAAAGPVVALVVLTALVAMVLGTPAGTVPAPGRTVTAAGPPGAGGAAGQAGAGGAAGQAGAGGAAGQAGAGGAAGQAGAGGAAGQAGETLEPWQLAFERRRVEGRRGSLTTAALGDSPLPNILVLMTDDMRDDDLRLMPNVQRLIGDGGVQFDNMFSPQPLCCPARASFLTGEYTHNHGVWSHLSPYGFRSFDDRETLPLWLQEAGYTTAFTGKYLNGYGSQRLLSGGSSVRYVPPGWTDWQASVGRQGITEPWLAGSTYHYFDTTLNVGGHLEPHQGEYQTHLLSGVAQQMIRAGARSPEPFFAFISFVAPHAGGPVEPDDPVELDGPAGTRTRLSTPARPRYVEGRFDDRITELPAVVDEPGLADKPVFVSTKPPMTAQERAAVLENYRQRVEALSVVDDEVANIMATLERTGQLDNTFVLFTSDNGFFLGEHRIRAGKLLAYEPSLRVPLLVRGPGLPPGEHRTDPFLMIDVAPTLLEAAGVAVPDTVDGVSLLDVARNGDRGWTRGVLTETGPRRLIPSVERALVDSGNLLDLPEGPSRLRFSQGVRTGRYLYVEHASRQRELYDLREDPQELVNLVAAPRMRPVVARLAQVLDRLRTCVGTGCAEPLPASLRSRNPVPPYAAPLSAP